MNKPKILIVEDNPEEANHLHHVLLGFQHQIVGSANNLEDARNLFDTHCPNVCIIDIFLGKNPDGIVLAKHISDSNEKAAILFLTNNYDTITFYFAKTTNPHSYLLKPYNPLELQYAIELAMEKIDTHPIHEADTLFIKKGNAMSRISIHDIKYIEVEGRYSKIVCRSEKFLIQQPLKELLLQLPSALFSRMHRNFIVNVTEVTRIDIMNNEIFLKDGSSLFFSRRYLDDLLFYSRVLK